MQNQTKSKFGRRPSVRPPSSVRRPSVRPSVRPYVRTYVRRRPSVVVVVRPFSSVRPAPSSVVVRPSVVVVRPYVCYDMHAQ